MTVIEKLKANLFELTYVFDHGKRKNIVDSLSVKITETLHAINTVFFIYNKWELQNEVKMISSNNSFQYREISVERFMEHFDQHSDVINLAGNNPLLQLDTNANVLLKIHKREHFYMLILLQYENELPYSNETFKHVQNVLEQFLITNYLHRQHEFIHHRHEIMFQLSTKLHSVHKTSEVLEKVYQTSQLIYPSFEFYFLMSHEVECRSLPVKLIEYTKEASSNPGIVAFINGELQIQFDKENDKTHIYAPLSGNQGVYGVFQIVIPVMIQLEKSEIQFIKDLTNMVGRAIERTTLYQSSNKRVSDLQVINVASHELNLNLQIDDITETVKKHIFHSCHADQIGVVLFESEYCEKSIEILRGSTDFFKTEIGNMFVESVYQNIMKNRKPFFSGNYQSDIEDIPFKSLMVIPMNSSESIIGMIIIMHQNPYYFSFDTFKFIQTYVQHAALAFTNSILTERLKRLATTDHLTKLYSRSHIDELIQHHMQQNGQGALILFDVDDFKLINDTYGHYVGDKVLIQVANIIKSEMKEDQIAARWGGEEFAVYLPSANLAESTAKAEQIRKKVNELTNPKVSLSCGVSIWTKGQEDSIEKLFIRADKALYEAKAAGKNRVVQSVAF